MRECVVRGGEYVSDSLADWQGRRKSRTKSMCSDQELKMSLLNTQAFSWIATVTFGFCSRWSPDV